MSYIILSPIVDSFSITDIILLYLNFCYVFTGINIFLDGFVPTENMRFRTESLVFKVAESATEEEVLNLFTSYFKHFSY